MTHSFFKLKAPYFAIFLLFTAYKQILLLFVYVAALPTPQSRGISLRLVRQQLHLRSKPPRASPRPLLVPTEPEPIDPMVTPGPPLSLMMRCLHSGPSQSSGVIVAITATNCSIPSSVFSLNTFSFPDSPVLESGDLVVAESVAGLFLSLALWSCHPGPLMPPQTSCTKNSLT